MELKKTFYKQRWNISILSLVQNIWLGTRFPIFLDARYQMPFIFIQKSVPEHQIFNLLEIKKAMFKSWFHRVWSFFRLVSDGTTTEKCYWHSKILNECLLLRHSSVQRQIQYRVKVLIPNPYQGRIWVILEPAIKSFPLSLVRWLRSRQTNYPGFRYQEWTILNFWGVLEFLFYVMCF